MSTISLYSTAVCMRPLKGLAAPLARLILLMLLMMLLGPSLAHSESNADACLVEWLELPRDLSYPNEQQRLSGQTLTQTDSDTFWLNGQVELQENGLWIHANQAIYNRQTRDAQLFGQVRLQQNYLLMHAPALRYFSNPQALFAEDLRYQFVDSRAHGQAASLYGRPDQEVSYLTQASFTTCALTHPDWTLKGRELEINQQDRRLYIKHAHVRFYGVPIFYSPYLDIPLDDRATGLLFPYIGSIDAIGHDGPPLGVYAQPYFINIAPNLDTTLTLTAIESRGVMFDNEWRYLQPKHSGQVHLGFIKDQRVKDQGQFYQDRSGNLQQADSPAERWRFRFSGQQQWHPRLRSNLVWHEISDPDYYNDLPTDFTESAVGASMLRTLNTQLERRASLNYAQGNFNAQLNYLGFLPLRNGESNYLEKAPEIRMGYGQNLGPWRLNLQTEHTEFVRYRGFNDYLSEGRLRGLSNSEQMGSRLLLQPSLNYRASASFGYVSALVQGNQRHYKVTEPYASTDPNSSNTVWQFALRAGLVFERDLRVFNQAWQQTLEPEIQYLRVPYVKQSQLPVYDSAAASLDFSNLFALNRFSGVDRIGDTDQVTLALTSRFLDSEGAPKIDLAAGQIIYLKDRQVGLPAERLITEKRSDYYLRARSFFNQFTLSSTHQFDEQTRELKQSNNRLEAHWRPHISLLVNHQGFNLNDRNASRSALGLGSVIRLSETWQLAGYSQIDLKQNTRLQNAAGIRYESCCWSSELIIEQALRSDGRYNSAIKYVFELKGLSNIGNRLADTLRRELDF